MGGHEEVEMEQKDRIVFSAGNSWLSKAIMWFTRGKASHSFFVYYDQDFEADMILEATGGPMSGGFRIIDYEDFKKKNKIILEHEARHDLSVGFKKSRKWLGAQYDLGGLIGFIWVLLGRWLRKTWHNPFCSSRALFCSEAVARVCQWSSYPGFEEVDPETMSPQDLIDIFEQEARQEACEGEETKEGAGEEK